MEAKNEQTSEDAMILKDALTEADRYRNMDRLIASPHNVVTIAALEVGSAWPGVQLNLEY